MTNPAYLSMLGALGGVMTMQVIGNIAQIGVRAGPFMLLGEFVDLASALYHSAVNFSTLGYGDSAMTGEHRLLGPLEAVNGVLMIGASTAVLVTAFQDPLKKTIMARRGGGE